MRDGYIGAGGIDTVQSALARPPFYEGRDPMGCKDNGALRNLLQDACPVWSIECYHTKIR